MKTRSAVARPHRRRGQPAQTKGGARAAARRPARLTASTADKHWLYEEAVQDAEGEIAFIDRASRAVTGRKPKSLREDFCGTALVCARWIESDPERTATGVDLDRRVLEWGRRRHLSALGEPGKRIRLLAQDVRTPTSERYDVVNALNFSYWVFKTRADMLAYFRGAKRSLNRDGIFCLDTYGGWDAMKPMQERRRVRGGFTYVWDQNRVDPITNHVLNHIHFEFRDGTKLEKAFTYDWRLWTLPEIQELLYEAGFSAVRVYWDESEDIADTDYRLRRHAANERGWLAYVVAIP